MTIKFEQLVDNPLVHCSPNEFENRTKFFIDPEQIVVTEEFLTLRMECTCSGKPIGLTVAWNVSVPRHPGKLDRH